MYKAENMNIIILHFKGNVSFKILFFEIKDKNLLINKFFTEAQKQPTEVFSKKRCPPPPFLSGLSFMNIHDSQDSRGGRRHRHLDITRAVIAESSKKIIAILTGKHLCWGLVLKKFMAFRF